MRDFLLALLYQALALFGIDPGHGGFVHRQQENGRDSLYARVQVQAGVGRFQCVRSATGACHFTVLPDACDRPQAPCASGTSRRLVVADGRTDELRGLQRVRVCVSNRARGPDMPCGIVGRADPQAAQPLAVAPPLAAPSAR